jgi:predicted XRE-type DNA-binding protein
MILKELLESTNRNDDTMKVLKQMQESNCNNYLMTSNISQSQIGTASQIQLKAVDSTFDQFCDNFI